MDSSDTLACPAAEPRLASRRQHLALWRQLHGRRVVFLAVLLGLLAVTALAGLGIGAVAIAPSEVVQILLAHCGVGTMPEGYSSSIVLNIRLPRVLAGCLVGAALAGAGAAIQGLFRNPLADPGLIGVSSGAGFGAVLCIVFFPAIAPLAATIGVGQQIALPLCAFVFAVGTTFLIYALSTHRGQVQVATMLLAGIAINSLAGAATGFALFKANDDQLRDITFWSLGSLARASWGDLQVLALPMILCLVALPLFARILNALLLGEDEAARLGFPVQTAKRIIIVLSAFAVAGAVAMTGLIGFLGLVVPHLVRLVIGPDHRFLLIASPLLGGSLLVLADVLARIVVAPSELPIGVVTALLGAPFFLGLLLSQRARIVQ